MKIAIIHDWFKANGGAEKVAGEILDTFQHEDEVVYTLFNKFSDQARKEILKQYPVRVSALQYVPGIANIYRFLLPVMPWLAGRFNLDSYDLVLSSSHAVAKGVKKGKGKLHICYCHTPMRYVWDMYDDYAAHHAVGRWALYRWFIGRVRKWDLDTAQDIDFFIANSEHVKRRIEDSYKRPATVIYPPVRVQKFELSTAPRQPYYLCMGRFVPYKKADLIIEAFQQMPDKQLYLIGEGYGTKKFQEMLNHHPNIKWLGYQNDESLIRYIQNARACIFAAKEDFGIMCVEVQACGTPVLALNYGGYQETVIAGQTGYFFDRQDKQSIIAAVNQLESHPLNDHHAIRQNALRFSAQRFQKEMADFVYNAMTERQQ